MAMAETIQRESRVKKTLLNARVNLIFYFLTLCLSFFSRKIFLDCLGADFVGLTGTLQNLLGFLNLAELGIGSAIGYVLYKPLFDRDQTKINEIISVMGYLYRWIGFVILGGGIILSFFLPMIFPDSDTGFNLPLIYSAYYAFLGSSLIGYFINYRQNLLGADQRNYVVTAYFQTTNLVKTIIQMALAYYTGNLYLWIAIEFAFGIIYSFILNWKINQTYPWLRAEIALGRQLLKKYPEVKTKTKQLFVHKIGAVVQQQTTPFLIYAFVNLTTVAFYGNYTLIITKINQLISNFLGSTDAGVGNLIAENNSKKIIKIYWELTSLRFIIASTAVFLIYQMINPFIRLWLGDGYLLGDNIIIAILITTFVGMIRGTNDQFIFGYGLFKDTWAPLAESGIYVAVAIICGYYFGLFGILMGSITSLIIIIGIWKPYFLFKQGFKMRLSVYWINFLKFITITIGSFYVCHKLLGIVDFVNPNDNFITWIVFGMLATFLFLMLYIPSLSILTPGTKSLLKRLKHK